MKTHWYRLWRSILGQHRPADQPGRDSPYKGYWGELGHSLKNVWVEGFRNLGIELNPRRR